MRPSPQRASKPFLRAEERGHPPEPLSFDLVHRVFLTEYGRRFDEYIEGGGKTGDGFSVVIRGRLIEALLEPRRPSRRLRGAPCR